ncbi:MAG: TonB-dependent receptor plug domain-containing protein [Nibricoccus sp.]
MKRVSLPILRTTAIFALSAFATTAYSQVVKKSEAIPTEPAKEQSATPEDPDELIVLSPFEVSTATDKGYAATETMASTRLRTDLKDVASSVSVYTPAFMKDIGATDAGTLLQYTTNAEVAGTRGSYAGLGNNASLDDTASLRWPSNNQRVRGLDAADNTRDLFSTDIPFDSFNSDRIEILRGANSLLFGLGSPAGIINTGLRSAEFRNTGSVEFRVGSYGSTRESLDANVQIVPKVLAIRIAAMNKNEKFQQKPAFEDAKRYYGAIRFEPKLFDKSAFKTIFKVNFEKGDVDANRPRITPPVDKITPWFSEQDRTSMFGGMIQSGTTKFVVSNPYSIGAAPATVQPWLTAPVNQQQPAWYMDGTTGQLYSAQGGFIHIGARNNAGAVSNSGMPALRYSSQFYGINGLNGYANEARLAGYQYGQYKDQSLMDPTVFDFYNNLIDGPTKSEFEDWQSYNFDFTQTAFNDRLGLQITVDRQNYNRGGQSLLGWAPTISVDLTQQFQDGTPNPNFGRPYIIGNSGNGTSYESDRTVGRAQLFGELRATDLMNKGFLTKLLGRHRFQGLYSNEVLETDNRAWDNVANSQAWQGFWTGSDGSAQPFRDRNPMSIIYSGPSLLNAASARGANIPRIMAPIVYPDANIRVFNSQWNAPGSVSPTATYTPPTTGWESIAINPTHTTPNIFQASNPANYVGWSSFPMQLQRYNDGANPYLLSKASLSKRTVKSYSTIWTGFMWNDAIVPTLGWRYDRVTSQFVTTAYNTVAAHSNFATTGSRAYVLPTGPVPLNADGTKMLDYSNQNYRIDNGHSTSGGVVVHLNKLFTRDFLPLNVSLTYNKSQNFQVTDPRNNVFGKPLANPEGKTKEYGLMLSTKDRKYSLRIIKYDSYVSNATISGFDMSGISNMPQQGIRFRNVFLYQLSPAYLWTQRETPADRNNWQTAWVDNTTGRPVAAGSVATGPANSHLQTAAEATAMRDASIRAWNQIQADLQAKGFWSAWGLNPVPVSALTDRATYEAGLGAAVFDPAAGRNIAVQTNAQYAVTDPNTIQAYLATTPQNLSITSDTQSKGYEYEFVANPTKNWRIQMSASKTEATRRNVGGPEIDSLVTYFDGLMTGPAGDMRQFSGGYSPTNEVRQNWNNWRSKYTAAKIQEGSGVPEIRKWRYVITTNYSFDTGFLKGVGVGTSYRWMDKVVIGYPTLVIDATKATYDLSKPYYGPSEDGLDAWISYERKLTSKLRWKVQFNVRNILYKNGRIPITVEPDGQTWAGVRIKPTQEWFLTNTLMF